MGSARLAARFVIAMKPASMERWIFAHSCVCRTRGSARLAASGLLSFVSSKESNQRKDDPGIRADRALPDRFPAVLAAQRPANNSAIPGLGQFAFPRWSAVLLGATAGDPFEARARAKPASAWARRMRAGPGPLWRGGQAQERPAGWARGIAPSSLPAQGCAVSEPRSLTAKSQGRACPGLDPGMPGDRGIGVRFLLVTSLWRIPKRSNPRAARRAEPLVRHNLERAKSQLSMLTCFSASTRFAAKRAERSRKRPQENAKREIQALDADHCRHDDLGMQPV